MIMGLVPFFFYTMVRQNRHIFVPVVSCKATNVFYNSKESNRISTLAQ